MLDFLAKNCGLINLFTKDLNCRGPAD